MRRLGVIVLMVLAFLIGLLSGCSYDGYYRYPCQNPENIETAPCIPPLCEYNDQCSKDLIGDSNE